MELRKRNRRRVTWCLESTANGLHPHPASRSRHLLWAFRLPDCRLRTWWNEDSQWGLPTGQTLFNWGIICIFNVFIAYQQVKHNRYVNLISHAVYRVLLYHADTGFNYQIFSFQNYLIFIYTLNCTTKSLSFHRKTKEMRCHFSIIHCISNVSNNKLFNRQLWSTIKIYKMPYTYTY